MVIGPQPRRPSVASAGGEPRGVKRAHLRGRSGAETPVAPSVGAGRIGLIHAEIAVAVISLAVALPITDRALLLVNLFGAERRHDGIVEACGAQQVSYCDREMINQMHVADPRRKDCECARSRRRSARRA